MSKIECDGGYCEMCPVEIQIECDKRFSKKENLIKKREKTKIDEEATEE